MNEQLDRMEIKLAELQGKIDEMGESVGSMRRYFQWAFWITIGVIVLPLLVLPLLIPAFLSAVTGAGLGF